MIAACPECRTQYRVDPERLSDEGVRLRCTRCQTIFRVRAPQAAPAPVPVAAPAEPAPIPASATASDSQAPTPAPAPGEWTPLSERLVLVATPDADNAKRWVEAIQGWGLEAESAHDGVEAILKIHRRWPAVVVLDPQLPKMFGFQVCEVIKRNDTLRRIGVVLVGAIHHPQRYRRAPTELYGADSYVEEPDMPEALAPALRDLGLPIGPSPVQAPTGTPAALPDTPLPAPEAVRAVPAGPMLGVDAPTVPPPVPAEATLPPLAVQPQPDFAVASSQPEVAPAPPPVPEDLTIPPPDLTLPPVVVEPDAAPAPEPELAPAPAPVAAPALESIAVSTPEAVAAPVAVAEPEPVAPVLPDPAPAIGSPEYDVVDPDDASSVAPEPRLLVAEPEPAVAPSPQPAAAEPEVLSALEPMPEPVATPEPEPEPEPAPEPAAAVDPEVAQAERLARIIISDVVLYNEDKFSAACEAGNLLGALEGDMADGRAHFASRVPEHVRNARDFLADELMRLAKSRGLL
ncbi:MAG: zinc-ribbon domain-containing protein [Deltaproteobacteria bacterium]|nr:zinc-ribbon domain-containing protein [Deltaproteobacteria bacterium]